MAVDASSNPRSQNRSDDHSNPYFLSNNESPGISLVSQPLIGSENYNTWSISMTVALDSKTKFGFVNGEIDMPEITDLMFKSWKRVNSMVISWILNSVSKEIASSIIYMKIASEIWNDLKERFSETNNPRIFQLKRAICGLNQEQMSVNTYFTKLKILWEEYSSYNLIPQCSNGSSCAALRMVIEFQRKEYTMQFLMGLNDTYANLRSQILLNDPLPPINKVFASVVQEERQRSLSPFMNQIVEPVAFVSKTETEKSFTNGGFSNFKTGFKKDKGVCTHCGLTGHVVDKCYKLHGYPPGYKFKNKNPGQSNGNGHGYSKNFGNNYGNHFQAASVQDSMGQDSSVQAPVTQGQFQQLMAMIQNQMFISNPSSAQNSYNATIGSPSQSHNYPMNAAAASSYCASANQASNYSHNSASPIVHKMSGLHPLEDDWTG